ncbi:hypothetical protein [Chondromyces apiculatus]|uniref:Lipoprotein n=1 Tax=Chondromyces apiculatus DSM 436 TaxID=1192034 RepID=A0A017T755_9BACT|nr:hypothetical protein [Chondromyces apiculatus]EYF05068.1 Hypothetical protein CAP_3658 [Chondromyces apiculatus DSM 436]
MKKMLVTCAMVFLAACSKEAGTEGTQDSAKPGSTTAAKPAAAQKGLEPGEVVVGYLQVPDDEAQCALLPVPEAEKAKFDSAKINELAGVLKAKVVTSCPTDNIVGTCKAMGMLVNYQGPKYTKETAQADCAKGMGKWLD